MQDFVLNLMADILGYFSTETISWLNRKLFDRIWINSDFGN